MHNLDPDQQLVVGIDIGTTSVKGGVFNRGGEALSTYCENYSRSRPAENWVEQNPMDWFHIIERAVAHFATEIELANISHLSLCSQVNTHVFVDESGVPLMPAIVWQDTRTKDIAAELDASFSTEEKMEIWGTEFILDSSFALSRAVWVARNQPQDWAKTKWIFSPKDFCNHMICGTAASDALSSVGLIGLDGAYLKKLDKLLPEFGLKLPPLKDIFEPLGQVKLDKFPQLKATLVNGTMDAWSCFFGSGMVKPGRASLTTGTSSIFGIMSDKTVPTKGVISFPPFMGNFVHAGPTQAGSDALPWIAKGDGIEIAEILEKISERGITKHLPLFLPHLDGERAPIWDPNARGCFIGLSHQHDGIDMAHAVIEGVAFSERHLFEECCKAAGYTPESARLSGGSSIDDYWSQLRCNILGIRLERTNVRNSGALGAAVIAAFGSGQYISFADVVDARVKIEKTFIPCVETKAMFGERYALYRASFNKLKPIFDRMAAA